MTVLEAVGVSFLLLSRLGAGVSGRGSDAETIGVSVCPVWVGAVLYFVCIVVFLCVSV